MTFSRLAISHDISGFSPLSPVFTYQRDDVNRRGVWSRPDVPLLIFADSDIGTARLRYNHGPVGGAPGGHPVQLIYWGQWWDTQPGQQRQMFMRERTQWLLQSTYFGSLTQYGIPHAPIWRGDIVATKPAPPVQATARETTRQALDLVSKLIADDVFPDPDDGPRIAFIVLLPDGFTLAPADGGVLGAHSGNYDWDFPFDEDSYWVGWVRPEPANPDFAMVTLSHELSEILTDPEGDAWRLAPEIGTRTEICDVAFSGGTKQNAFVNNVQVEAYWSDIHGANIIPIDRDYAACLRARITEDTRSFADSGSFRPEPAESAACPDIRECCFSDRDFEWRRYTVNETARVRLDTKRFKKPVAAWTINGTAVSGRSNLTINVQADGFVGRVPTSAIQPVTVHFNARPDGIDVWTSNAALNFAIVMGCSVTDGSITGKVAVNVVATPTIVVDFIGAVLLLEDAFIEQQARCWTAMIRRFAVNYEPTGKPGPGEKINFVQELMAQQTLPAYIRPSQYQQLRLASRAARAASAVLSLDAAAAFARSLVDTEPVLRLMAMGRDDCPAKHSAT